MILTVKNINHNKYDGSIVAEGGSYHTPQRAP